MRIKRLWALIACHNRRPDTVRCIERLYLAAGAAGVELKVVLLDDGSTDGTAQVVAEKFPDVILLDGDGKFFWARSMATAESKAMDLAASDDWLLWLNDDVVLRLDALKCLVTASSDPSAIYVGATTDQVTGEVTYGGLVRSGWHPLSLRLSPLGSRETLSAFNGNFVALAVATARFIGGIDERYAHGMADIDYGLRAARMRIRALQLKTPVGTCSRNEVRRYSSRRAAWQAYRSVRGAGHPVSMGRLLRRATPLWPLWYLTTIVTWWGRRARPTPKMGWTT